MPIADLGEFLEPLVEICHELREEEEGLAHGQPLQVGAGLSHGAVQAAHQLLVRHQAQAGEVQVLQLGAQQLRQQASHLCTIKETVNREQNSTKRSLQE
jgi:hypothetical protein